MTDGLKKRVEFILINYPLSRSSDKVLSMLYLEHFGQDEVKEKGFVTLGSSMKRYRALFQQQGLYLPDESVKEKRELLKDVYKKEMIQPKKVVHQVSLLKVFSGIFR